jgi:hypothetical protein
MDDIKIFWKPIFCSSITVTPPKIGLLKGRKVLTLTSQTMKNSIITEAQIVKAIKEYEGGRELGDICRELGVHKSTFYNCMIIA